MSGYFLGFVLSRFAGGSVHARITWKMKRSILLLVYGLVCLVACVSRIRPFLSISTNPFDQVKHKLKLEYGKS